jgi:hypothetical protein
MTRAHHDPAPGVSDPELAAILAGTVGPDGASATLAADHARRRRGWTEPDVLPFPWAA